MTSPADTTSGPAFGAPGIPPTWASSAKDLVTTALGASRVWATLGFGILNEVFWPATGDPQLRDAGFVLANDAGWVELKRENRYAISLPEPAVPLPTVVHDGPGYRFTFELVPDSQRDVLLLAWRLEGDFRAYVLVAPHVGVTGLHNTAWVGDELIAENAHRALAVATSLPFTRASAGFVGASDGWQDFAQHGRMTWTFDRAEAGNVAMMAELAASSGLLALGFGETVSAARTLARASLSDGLDDVRERCLAGWRAWARELALPAPTPEIAAEAALSAAVIRVHEDRAFPGAIVASLSTPWGNSSDSPGGYHLVWARDAVESAFALDAIGQRPGALRALDYLASTQQSDGHWLQNFYPDGRPFWEGVQLDETAFPILLAARLAERGERLPKAVVSMIRHAATFLARTGPMSPQDRWEENAGVSPFTIAAVVAALVAAAGWLEPADREYALSLADGWNERIESWCYVEGTALDARFGVPGHYVRIAPPRRPGMPARVDVRNRAGASLDAAELVGLEFLYLPRLGLRRPDDPRILASLRLADAVLGVDTPSGRLYHRYNEDGYGEHEDGRPFDGRGVGRAWPLLSGERGHLAMMLGEDPLPYLETMMRTAGPCGMLPEQAWDAAAIPDRFLFPGRPSGSAMPLVWAHSEFLKLLVARETGRPIEYLRVVEARYPGASTPRAQTWHWRADSSFDAVPADRDVLIEDPRPFQLHVGVDGWQGVVDATATPVGLGMYGVRLRASALGDARAINFTRRFHDAWEGSDVEIRRVG